RPSSVLFWRVWTGAASTPDVVLRHRSWPADVALRSRLTGGSAPDSMASMLLVADLPDNPDALRAIILAQEEEHRVLKDQMVALKTAGAEADAEITRLTAIIAAFQRHRFGARSEKLDDDQFELALEELGAAPSALWLPRLRERDRAGAGPAAHRRRRHPDRGAGRACPGRQVRRSSSPVSAGADLRPPGRPPRSLDACRLGRAGRVVADPA